MTNVMSAEAMSNFINSENFFTTLVRDFMNKFGFLDEPYTEERLRQRDMFLLEEFKEWEAAKLANNDVDILDALCDIVYVACGTILVHGRSSTVADVVCASAKYNSISDIEFMWLYHEYVNVVDTDQKIEILTKIIVSAIALSSTVTDDKLTNPFSDAFVFVHVCNMNKIRGEKATRPGTGGFDCIKPEGWVGPEANLATLIKKKGL